MKIKRDHLRIAHIPRHTDGTKVEAEEQPVERRREP